MCGAFWPPSQQIQRQDFQIHVSYWPSQANDEGAGSVSGRRFSNQGAFGNNPPYSTSESAVLLGMSMSPTLRRLGGHDDLSAPEIQASVGEVESMRLRLRMSLIAHEQQAVTTIYIYMPLLRNTICGEALRRG